MSPFVRRLPEPGPEEGASVHVLPWSGSDEELLARLRGGGPQTARSLYDRFAPDVHRLVWRLLGADPDHDDVVQLVFCHLLSGLRRLRDAAAVRGWVLAVTVHTVRSELRKRVVRRRFRAPSVDLDRFESVGADDAARALLARTFAILEKVPVDERVAFLLRHVDGQSLQEVASLCRVSLATAKRRLKRAEERFVKLAARDPDLTERLRGSRWEQP